MTVFASPRDHLLTVAEYAALEGPEWGYTELQEGLVLVSPSPVPDHNVAGVELILQLRPQLPAHLEVIPDVDVDLELVAADEPGFARRPDLVIVHRGARDRVRAHGGLIRASEVEVIVEIVSPGSRRMDYRTKHEEYADAGIPRYWIVDLTDPLSLVDCQLAAQFGYQDATAVTSAYTSTVTGRDGHTFTVTLALDRLL